MMPLLSSVDEVRVEGITEVATHGLSLSLAVFGAPFSPNRSIDPHLQDPSLLSLSVQRS